MRMLLARRPELLVLGPLAAIILLNDLYLGSAWLGLIAGLGYFALLWAAFFLVLKAHVQAEAAALLSGLLPFAILAAVGGLAYFAYQFNSLVLLILLASPLALLFFLSKLLRAAAGQDDSFPLPTKKEMLAFILFLALSGVSLFFVISARTTLATSSLWEIVDNRILASFFLSSLAVLYLGATSRRGVLALVAQGLHLLFILALVVILFPLGFGFDPFVHQATESHILDKGFILPKTPYYAGYYALVAFFSRLLFIGHEWVDRLMVPLAAAALLPLGCWVAFAKKRFSLLALPLLLAAPFGMFVNSTPQSLASLLLLLVILLAASPLRKRLGRRAFLLALLVTAGGALAIHPIAGIPALVVVATFWPRRIPHPALLLPMAAVLPALFIIHGALTGASALSPAWHNPLAGLWPQVADRFLFLENGAYLFGLNAALIVLLLAAAAFLLRLPALVALAKRCWAAFAVILGSGLLTLWLVNFSSIISYERSGFGQRIVAMAFYALLPAALGSALFLWRAARGRALMVPLLLVAAFLGSAAFYSSFPHTDRFQTSRLYSLSAADLAAVDLIEADAAGAPYAVLANQITSAGALQRFGFSRFFDTTQGQLYSYPIPTSSPLYELYLEMAEGQPSPATVQKARDLMDTDNIYMIFNSYWTNFEAQIQKIAQLASETFVVEDGAAWVFKFAPELPARTSPDPAVQK